MKPNRNFAQNLRMVSIASGNNTKSRGHKGEGVLIWAMRPTMTFSPSHASGGFTLVELMVVVAIIGVLSAVAVPNFKKYQAKSKTTEAKIQLAAAYTALQSFRSEYDTYQVCLKYMGYNPANEAAQRYYTVGFSTLSISDCADCYTIAA